MSYNFPYTILRQDLKELEVGYFIKVGDRFGIIVSKNPMRFVKPVTVDAGKQLTIRFSDADSNLDATSGIMTIKGFVGSNKKTPKVLVQYKYIAFTTPTECTLKWGRDQFPLHAGIKYSSVNAPAGLIQSGNVGASPLPLNKFSTDPALYLEITIDNSAGSTSASQTIILEAIEYEYEDVGRPAREYDEITNKGHIIHRSA
jgi:hypothetical protein